MPEVNGERTLEHDGIVANPNCCAIPLTMARKPLHDAAGLARVRVSTYRSVSGVGAQGMEKLRATPSGEGNLAMDWDFDGEELWAWLGPRSASHPCARGVVRPASSISGRF